MTHSIDLNDINQKSIFLRCCPKAWQPYIRLCRLDRPVGTLLTLFPTLGALFLAQGGIPSVLRLVVFALGAWIMRSAGCVINDLADRHFDVQVNRTRYRPLACGELKVYQAVYFLIFLLFLASGLLFFVNMYTSTLAVCLLPLVFLYPFCKRFTYWPQVVLGLAFNWGILMAWTDTQNLLPLSAVLFWLGAVSWQVGYDTLYAYTDMEDDSYIGVYSTALRFKEKGKSYLTFLYIFAIVLWAVVGYLLNLQWYYNIVLMCLGVHLVSQLVRFDVMNRLGNFKLFKENIVTAFLLFIACVVGTIF